jgi:hypothetical protein
LYLRRIGPATRKILGVNGRRSKYELQALRYSSIACHHRTEMYSETSFQLVAIAQVERTHSSIRRFQSHIQHNAVESLFLSQASKHRMKPPVGNSQLHGRRSTAQRRRCQITHPCCASHHHTRYADIPQPAMLTASRNLVSS